MTDEKSKKQSQTKATDSPRQVRQRRQERNNGRGNSETADWQSVDSESVIELIARVTSLKGTITFGYTKDGGAYYVNYYVDGQSDRIYIRPQEDIDRRITDEIESWQ